MNKLIFASLLVLASTSALNAADYTATEGDWTIKISESTNKMSISYNGINLFNDAYATVTYNFLGDDTDYIVSSQNPSAMPEIKVESADDCFGIGKTYIFSYPADGAVMNHRLSFYESLPYMIVSVDVTGNDGRELQSRSLKALAIGQTSTPLNGASNRVVCVPFDNDGHLKYEVSQLTNSKEIISHEVGYVFDGDSRRGIVAGSVDHDKWKSGVTIAGASGYKLEKFECLSGYTDQYTRDVLPHGKVKGKTVSSARYFVGLFDDWREGLNLFGEANAKVAPKAPWDGGNPMGWSSWGVQQNYINYAGVVESAEFIKNNLYDLGFHNKDGQTVISLDAFASDNISSANLYKLGTKVFSDETYKDGRETKEGLNMILGQYCGPLVAWQWALDSKVPGTGLNGSSDYTYRDIALKVNGDVYVVTSNNGCAVDPTHPGVKANIEYFMRQFSMAGTKYIKADFLNNGIVEGDSWYDPEVTTGVQAYNYGMNLLYEEAKKYGMYIVESISPIFPYQYAHGRRTCCDRFSEMGETEYVMNSITYGWWTDRLYSVNDPDQLVMCKGGNKAKETLGENRARATSGMATGAFIFGDNFSDNVVYTDDNGHTKGDIVGYPETSRTRALQIMGNADINEYVRNNTGSFMPVDGHKPSTSQSAESMFVRRVENQLYLAIFNYKSIFASSGSVEFSRLGITSDDVITEIKELWSGDIISSNGESLSYSVPAKDVKVYRFTFKPAITGVETVSSKAVSDVSIVNSAMKQFTISANMEMKELRIYDISGKFVYSLGLSGETTAIADLAAISNGVYLADVVLADGFHKLSKIVNK